MRRDTPSVALLIDYDNLEIGASYDMPGRPLDLGSLIELAQRYGTVVVARAYADWGDPNERLAVYESGIEPCFAPIFRTTADQPGKSLADTVLVADGVDILWRVAPEFLVLVTSDKDILPLARLARLRGTRTVVVGSDRTAVPLRRLADEYVTYKDLVRGTGVPVATHQRAGLVPLSRSSTSEPRGPRLLTEARPAPEPRRPVEPRRPIAEPRAPAPPVEKRPLSAESAASPAAEEALAASAEAGAPARRRRRRRGGGRGTAAGEAGPAVASVAGEDVREDLLDEDEEGAAGGLSAAAPPYTSEVIAEAAAAGAMVLAEEPIPAPAPFESPASKPAEPGPEQRPAASALPPPRFSGFGPLVPQAPSEPPLATSDQTPSTQIEEERPFSETASATLGTAESNVEESVANGSASTPAAPRRRTRATGRSRRTPATAAPEPEQAAEQGSAT